MDDAPEADLGQSLPAVDGLSNVQGPGRQPVVLVLAEALSHGGDTKGDFTQSWRVGSSVGESGKISHR